MDAGPKQCLVGINVSDAGDDLLIEYQRLDWRGSPLQAPDKVMRREPGGERFRAELSLERFEVVRFAVADPSELALVRKAERAVVIEDERDVFEPDWLIARPRQRQVPCHPEVDDQPASVIEIDQQILAAASDIDDFTTLEQCCERCGIMGGNDGREVPKNDCGYGAADQSGQQRAADCFDFGEFRHCGC